MCDDRECLVKGFGIRTGMGKYGSKIGAHCRGYVRFGAYPLGKLPHDHYCGLDTDAYLPVTIKTLHAIDRSNDTPLQDIRI